MHPTDIGHGYNQESSSKDATVACGEVRTARSNVLFTLPLSVESLTSIGWFGMDLMGGDD